MAISAERTRQLIEKRAVGARAHRVIHKVRRVGVALRHPVARAKVAHGIHIVGPRADAVDVVSLVFAQRYALAVQMRHTAP